MPNDWGPENDSSSRQLGAFPKYSRSMHTGYRFPCTSLCYIFTLNFGRQHRTKEDNVHLSEAVKLRRMTGLAQEAPPTGPESSAAGGDTILLYCSFWISFYDREGVLDEWNVHRVSRSNVSRFVGMILLLRGEGYPSNFQTEERGGAGSEDGQNLGVYRPRQAE